MELNEQASENKALILHNGAQIVGRIFSTPVILLMKEVI